MSKHLTTIEQPLTLIDRFAGLRERLAAPLAVSIETARGELDQRIVAHLNYRAAKLLDAMIGDDD